MDWLDYRQALGLSFNDDQKKNLFIKRIEVFMRSGKRYSFAERDEIAFAYMIGETYLPSDREPFAFCLDEELVGLQKVWPYLKKHTDNFLDFLATLVAFINTYKGKNSDKIDIFSAIKGALNDCHIDFEIVKDSDGNFIFPKGAKELDNALVSQPLEWLSAYPMAQKTFIIALKQYSEGIYIRDVADNLRKALEAFLQEFLGNEKNLETNKNEICKYLGSQGVDTGISGLFQPLLNAYKNINDRIVKHNDAVDKKLLEFLLYQTGVLIRMVVVIKMGENSHEV